MSDENFAAPFAHLVRGGCRAKAIEACYEHLDEAFVGLSLISLSR